MADKKNNPMREVVVSVHAWSCRSGGGRHRLGFDDGWLGMAEQSTACDGSKLRVSRVVIAHTRWKS